MTEELKKKIRIAMIRENINLSGLAKRMGFDRSYLSLLMNGKRTISINAIHRMCEVLPTLKPEDFVE